MWPNILALHEFWYIYNRLLMVHKLHNSAQMILLKLLKHLHVQQLIR